MKKRARQRRSHATQANGAAATNRAAARKSRSVREEILSTIRQIPYGKVLSYGGVAKAAGYPRHARQVVAVLQSSYGLPWHRVLGANGEIKLRGHNGIEQRLRLQAEGVAFRGRRVDMKKHEFQYEARGTRRTRRN